MTLAPWDYLFIPFNSHDFHDLFYPTWIAALVLLVALSVLYALRTRQLRHHPPYLELYEWLFWTGLITFSYILVASVFVFDFFLVLGAEVIGLAVLAWIRFIRFPPILAAYEQKLAKQRYFSRQRFSRPEATIRPKTVRRRRRR